MREGHVTLPQNEKGVPCTPFSLTAYQRLIVDVGLQCRKGILAAIGCGNAC